MGLVIMRSKKRDNAEFTDAEISAGNCFEIWLECLAVKNSPEKLIQSRVGPN